MSEPKRTEFKMRWERLWLYPMSDDEIIPKDDKKEHRLLPYTCACVPIRERDKNGRPMRIHNSWDCREAIEYAEQIVKDKP